MKFSLSLFLSVYKSLAFAKLDFQTVRGTRKTNTNNSKYRSKWTNEFNKPRWQSHVISNATRRINVTAWQTTRGSGKGGVRLSGTRRNPESCSTRRWFGLIGWLRVTISFSGAFYPRLTLTASLSHQAASTAWQVPSRSGVRPTPPPSPPSLRPV